MNIPLKCHLRLYVIWHILFMNYYFRKRLKSFARDLRNDATKAERVLWEELRRRKVRGYRFNRQRPIDRFIADFYSHQLRLVIEVDGLSHNSPYFVERDIIKDKRLSELGYTVLRFSDEEVYFDMDNVLREIEGFIDEFESNRLEL